MAVYFNLGANFRNSETAARKFYDYFVKKEITLSNGTHVPLEVTCTKIKNGEWIIGVFPEKMSINSPSGSNYALCEKPFYQEIEIFFYQQLKTAPAFQYAFFGREAYDYLLDIEETQSILKAPDFNWEGLIVNNKFWAKMSNPKPYKEFCEDYKWIPISIENL